MGPLPCSFLKNREKMLILQANLVFILSFFTDFIL